MRVWGEEFSVGVLGLQVSFGFGVYRRNLVVWFGA